MISMNGPSQFVSYYDKVIYRELQDCASRLEEMLDATLVFFNGPIQDDSGILFQRFMKKLIFETAIKDTLAIVLQTDGGILSPLQKMVSITRNHFKNVYFIVPNYAYSVGTIWCMSGDKIFMRADSSLGPVDPQARVGDVYVPGLGYLDRFNALVEKSRDKTITQAEFQIMLKQDQAVLAKYEAMSLVATRVITGWLVRYKFKDWMVQRSNPAKLNKPVTLEEKKEKAKEIAVKLGDHKRWLVHDYDIDMKTLREELRLEIEDYGSNSELETLIFNYSELFVEFCKRSKKPFMMHSKNHF